MLFLPQDIGYSYLHHLCFSFALLSGALGVSFFNTRLMFLFPDSTRYPFLRRARDSLIQRRGL